jgi:hypothetical protein
VDRGRRVSKRIPHRAVLVALTVAGLSVAGCGGAGGGGSALVAPNSAGFPTGLCRRLDPVAARVNPGDKLDGPASGPVQGSLESLAGLSEITPTVKATAGYACQWSPPGEFFGAVEDFAVHVVKTNRIVTADQMAPTLESPTRISGVGDWVFSIYDNGPALEVGKGTILFEMDTDAYGTSRQTLVAAGRQVLSVLTGG